MTGTDDDIEVSGVRPVRRRRSLTSEAKPSLTSPLLSGRSLQPPEPDRGWFARHWKWLVAAAVVVTLVGSVMGAKALAESAADSAMQQRRSELQAVLDGARPEDLMAFDAGVQRDGSIAQKVRDMPGFVNVRATANLAFIRFQPGGWWSGFTERCLVAYVRPDEVTISTPKTACVRVEQPSG